jgi:hypothetical protein
MTVLAFPIQGAGGELLKETLGLLIPRLWSDLPGFASAILSIMRSSWKLSRP